MVANGRQSRRAVRRLVDGWCLAHNVTARPMLVAGVRCAMWDKLVEFVGLAVFAVGAVFGVNFNTEEPSYDVVARPAAAVEIRRYKPRVIAEVTVETTTPDAASGEAFGILAGYIFGKNRGQTAIAMTAPVAVDSGGSTIAMTTPVEIRQAGSAMTMRFFLPAKYSLSELPVPDDKRVQLREMPAALVATLRYTGSSNPAAVTAKAAELAALLRPTQWTPVGSVNAYYYNPPWTLPFLRHNEVVVSVAP